MAGLAPFEIGAGMVLVFLVLLLVGEWLEARTLVWIAKPLASLGFLVAALSLGAHETTYGRWVLVALLLSFAGDVLLIPTTGRTFLAGLVSFLLGHVAYAVAFSTIGLAMKFVLGACVALALPVVGAIAWLRPHVEAEMRVPVLVYIAVITAMVVAAVGAVGAGAPIIVGLGALLFYLSDLAVARQRFVKRTFWNKSWGLPLYYGAQLLLAMSVYQQAG